MNSLQNLTNQQLAELATNLEATLAMNRERMDLERAKRPAAETSLTRAALRLDRTLDELQADIDSTERLLRKVEGELDRYEQRCAPIVGPDPAEGCTRVLEQGEDVESHADPIADPIDDVEYWSVTLYGAAA